MPCIHPHITSHDTVLRTTSQSHIARQGTPHTAHHIAQNTAHITHTVHRAPRIVQDSNQTPHITASQRELRVKALNSILCTTHLKHHCIILPHSDSVLLIIRINLHHVASSCLSRDFHITGAKLLPRQTTNNRTILLFRRVRIRPLRDNHSYILCSSASRIRNRIFLDRRRFAPFLSGGNFSTSIIEHTIRHSLQ